jgi:hypothetical protein
VLTIRSKDLNAYRSGYNLFALGLDAHYLWAAAYVGLASIDGVTAALRQAVVVQLLLFHRYNGDEERKGF